MSRGSSNASRLPLDRQRRDYLNARRDCESCEGRKKSLAVVRGDKYSSDRAARHPFPIFYRSVANGTARLPSTARPIAREDPPAWHFDSTKGQRAWYGGLESGRVDPRSSAESRRAGHDLRGVCALSNAQQSVHFRKENARPESTSLLRVASSYGPRYFYLTYGTNVQRVARRCR